MYNSQIHVHSQNLQLKESLEPNPTLSDNPIKDGNIASSGNVQSNTSFINNEHDIDSCSSDDSADVGLHQNNLPKQIPDHSSKNDGNTEMNRGNASKSGDLGSSKQTNYPKFKQLVKDKLEKPQ